MATNMIIKYDVAIFFLFIVANVSHIRRDQLLLAMTDICFVTFRFSSLFFV